MKLNSHAGHGKQDSKSCGAVGIVKESELDRLFNSEFIKLVKSDGNTIYDCTNDYPSSKSDNLNKIIAACNKNKVDLNISHHLNSGRDDLKGNGDIGGAEIWVYSKSSKAYHVAERILKNLESLGFKNRGVKISTEFAVLRKTNSPSMIIEYFFVDDKDDCDLYNKVGYKAIAKAVAEGVLNKSLSENKKTGWHKFGNNWSWWDGTKWLYDQWHKVGDSWFYLDAKGYTTVGWKKIDDEWYFFDYNGYMQRGWLKDKGKWYYLNTDGSMATGWINVNGKDYYLHENGVMENDHIDLNGKCYHFADSGELIKTTDI